MRDGYIAYITYCTEVTAMHSTTWTWTPWRSASLSEFWRRLNPPVYRASLRLFRYLMRKLKFRGACWLSILTVFIFNGLWHDIPVSLIIRRPSILWLTFFFLNGIGILLERRLKPKLQELSTGGQRMVTAAWIIVSLTVATCINMAFWG